MARTNFRQTTRLILALFDFVSTEVLLGLSVGRVLARNWVVLLEANLLSGVLSVLSRVIRTVASQFADQSNEFSLRILFRHISGRL